MSTFGSTLVLKASVPSVYASMRAARVLVAERSTLSSFLILWFSAITIVKMSPMFRAVRSAKSDREVAPRDRS